MSRRFTIAGVDVRTILGRDVPWITPTETFAMRFRPTLLAAPLALAALAALAACTPHQHQIFNPDIAGTALVVANHTDAPITVTYAQDPANTDATAMSTTDRVLPGYTLRLTGNRGDRVTIQAGDHPPLVYNYTDRSQTVRVTDDGGRIDYEIRKGFNDPKDE